MIADRDLPNAREIATRVLMAADDQRYGPEGDLTLRQEVERIRAYAVAAVPLDHERLLLVMQDRLPRLAAWLRQLADDLDADKAS